MPDQIEALRKQLAQTRVATQIFFRHVEQFVGGQQGGADLWGLLSPEDQARASQLREKVAIIMGRIGNAVANTPLISETDLADLRVSARRMMAAVVFRRYQSWGPSYMHDEDRALGVRPAGQSEDEPISVEEARQIVREVWSATKELFDLVPPAAPEPVAEAMAQQPVMRRAAVVPAEPPKDDRRQQVDGAGQMQDAEPMIPVPQSRRQQFFRKRMTANGFRTLKDLAKKLNVNVSTVSRVVSSRPPRPDKPSRATQRIYARLDIGSEDEIPHH